MLYPGLKRGLRPLAPSGRRALNTHAEAPAYSRSASPDFAKALSGRPRRGRFYSSAIHPASRLPVVSVLKTLTHTPQGGFCIVSISLKFCSINNFIFEAHCIR